MVNVLFPLPIVFQRRRPEMKNPIAQLLDVTLGEGVCAVS